MVRMLVLAGAVLLIGAGDARAVPDCPGLQPPTTVLSGQGTLESVITGPDGALYYTDGDAKALMRLAGPDATPKVFTPDVEAGGGLLLGLDGRSLILGYGDSLAGGALGNLTPTAGLYKVSLASGKKTPLVTGMSMANGLARDADGVIYGSDDVTFGIDRVEGTTVTPRWSSVLSPNGLAVDRRSRYLFANQTFQPAAIQRIPLDDPAAAEVYATPASGDFAAGLDGMTIDAGDRLFSAANQMGEVWRTGTDRVMCALARGLKQPSAVAFGGGGRFRATSLFAVGFGGELTEIPRARSTPAAPRVTIAPRRVRAGTRRRVLVTVRADGRPAQGARIRVGAHEGYTGARGRARFTVRRRHAGVVSVVAHVAGGAPAVGRSIRVRPKRRESSS